MNRTSALYAGTVVHQRLRPRRHHLRYRVFSALFDLGELPRLDRELRLFGYNRGALFSFHDRDHGDGQPGGLRNWVEARLAEAEIDIGNGRVTVLCYPRILGYVFNPLTLYFCYGLDEKLRAMLYEVGNTHGERHTYIIPVAETDTGVVQQSCEKRFFVSPFVPMDCSYDFRISPPGEKVLVSINEKDKEGPLMTASFAGRARELSDASLLAMFFAYPLMTLKVVAGIHYEAFKLWMKGTPVFVHRKAEHAVAASVVPARPKEGAAK